MANLERALKEERTGLVAVARAFLEASDNPGELLRRLEVMVRQAEASGAPARTRDAIAHGHAVLSRAAEQVQGHAQGLFDPDVGHVPPAVVERLSAPVAHQQLGLGHDSSAPLNDVSLRAQQQAAGQANYREAVLACYRDCGPLTDTQLKAEYLRRGGRVTWATLHGVRRDLANVGRIVRHTSEGEVSWKLLEQV